MLICAVRRAPAVCLHLCTGVRCDTHLRDSLAAVALRYTNMIVALCCRRKQGDNQEPDEERRIVPFGKGVLRMTRPVCAPFDLIDCGVLQLLCQHEA